jgi:hypothetical protein
MSASIDLTNEEGDPFGATASASLAPTGSPVTSTLLSADAKEKLVEQAMIADGELVFSTGDTFVIDESSCDAVIVESHLGVSGPAGPKADGKAPPNDGPDGAIEIAPGTRFNVQTTGTSVESEEPLTTCPEGMFDVMAHTLWYAIEGTGGPITIDTAGSNIDTLIAVYVPDGDGFLEVACIDDVFGDPIGITFQAALTIETEGDQTYFVQVGGFQDFFSGDVQFGRLRLRIS